MSAFQSTATNVSYIPPEQQVLHFTQQQQQQQPASVAFTQQQLPRTVVVQTAENPTAASGAGSIIDGPTQPYNTALHVDYSQWPTKFVEVGCKFRKGGPEGKTAVGQCINPGCTMTAEMYRLMCKKKTK